MAVDEPLDNLCTTRVRSVHRVVQNLWMSTADNDLDGAEQARRCAQGVEQYSFAGVSSDRVVAAFAPSKSTGLADGEQSANQSGSPMWRSETGETVRRTTTGRGPMTPPPPAVPKAQPVPHVPVRTPPPPTAIPATLPISGSTTLSMPGDRRRRGCPSHEKAKTIPPGNAFSYSRTGGTTHPVPPSGASHDTPRRPSQAPRWAPPGPRRPSPHPRTRRLRPPRLI